MSPAHEALLILGITFSVVSSLGWAMHMMEKRTERTGHMETGEQRLVLVLATLAFSPFVASALLLWFFWRLARAVTVGTREWVRELRQTPTATPLPPDPFVAAAQAEVAQLLEGRDP